MTDLGGAIDVESTLGEGTKFEIWLPVSGEIAVPAFEPEQALPRGNGQIIMIVDDERPLVALAEEIIAQTGYEPVGFDSSTAALAAFRADPDRFDAVLTDEVMPDLTGTELAQALRQPRAVAVADPAGQHLGSGHDDAGTYRPRSASLLAGAARTRAHVHVGSWLAVNGLRP